jgi:pSer/pThr/pTyr-binding forkhead associated (FHA) protein
MLDARLNSIHLEAPRRQEFRAAREKLLSARGGETVAAERREVAASSPGELNTAIQNLPENAATAAARYILMDVDYIYPLKVGLNTVGRMPDNDVVVPDAYVSRRHCAIVVHTADRCELHDIASKNGTYLNGHKINGPTRLHSGDQIRMCNRNLVFLLKVDLPEKAPAVQQTRPG